MASPILHNRRFTDLSGQRFGRLLAIERVWTGRRHQWRCKCDCGTIKEVSTAALTAQDEKARTLSCGCLRRESRPGLTHGLTNSPEHGVWSGIIQRTTNPNNSAYPAYGGTGIGICAGWRNSLPAFIADMGLRPDATFQADRIDNSRGYDCGRCEDCKARGATMNVRWATRDQNARNRSNNRMVEWRGETLAVAAWEERTGLASSVITGRLSLGWSPERVFTTPVRQIRKRLGAAVLAALEATVAEMRRMHADLAAKFGDRSARTMLRKAVRIALSSASA